MIGATSREKSSRAGSSSLKDAVPAPLAACPSRCLGAKNHPLPPSQAADPGAGGAETLPANPCPPSPYLADPQGTAGHLARHLLPSAAAAALRSDGRPASSRPGSPRSALPAGLRGAGPRRGFPRPPPLRVWRWRPSPVRHSAESRHEKPQRCAHSPHFPALQPA